MAIAALILGISSLVCCWIPFLGIGLSIAATILGAKGKNNPEKRGMAMAGMIMGIIAIVLSCIFTTCTMCTQCAAGSAASSSSYSSYYW